MKTINNPLTSIFLNTTNVLVILIEEGDMKQLRNTVIDKLTLSKISFINLYDQPLESLEKGYATQLKSLFESDNSLLVLDYLVLQNLIGVEKVMSLFKLCSKKDKFIIAFSSNCVGIPSDSKDYLTVKDTDLLSRLKISSLKNDIESLFQEVKFS